MSKAWGYCACPEGFSALNQFPSIFQENSIRQSDADLFISWMDSALIYDVRVMLLQAYQCDRHGNTLFHAAAAAFEGIVHV